MCGFACIIFGTLCNVLAIRFGDLLLLASSSALTLIFNTVLSVYILHESFTKWDVIAIILICTGSVSCMFFSKTSTDHPNDQEILDLFTSGGSLAYLILSALLVVMIYYIDGQARKQVNDGWAKIISL